MTGTLYLVPVPIEDNSESETGKISFDKIEKVLPSYNYQIIKDIKHFVVENIRSARRFLKSVSSNFNIDELTFYELNEHTSLESISKMIIVLKNKNNVALISEAGCPAVADPGATLVASCHKNNINVVPLVGPSSIILSLMASGLNGQNFSFVGYLPAKPNDRAKKLKQLEARAQNEKQTQIFIEAPYRNEQLFQTMLNTLNKNTNICIASNITGSNELIQTKTVKEWLSKPLPKIQKVPTIFAIGYSAF